MFENLTTRTRGSRGWQLNAGNNVFYSGTFTLYWYNAYVLSYDRYNAVTYQSRYMRTISGGTQLIEYTGNILIDLPTKKEIALHKLSNNPIYKDERMYENISTHMYAFELVEEGYDYEHLLDMESFRKIRYEGR